MPSSEIALSKTAAILGEDLDWEHLEAEDYEDVSELPDEPQSRRRRLLKKHMAAQAKSYRELERLILALYSIQDANSYLRMLTQ
jgi:nuclear pore complex protein Nup107